MKELYPEFAEQFDEIKNGKKSSEISYTYNKEVWWKCEKGHSWQAKLYNRTRNSNKDCPICTERKIVPGVNDFLTKLDKESKLYKELDFEKNDEDFLSKIHSRSKKEVSWKCVRGHRWKESIYNRSRGTDCPYCSRKRVSKERSITLSSLSEEYSLKNEKTSDEVSIESRTKVLWLCNNNHEFTASPYNRFLKGQNCPYCFNKKTLEGFNDLRTTHYALSQELNNKSLGSKLRFNEGTVVEWVCERCGSLWSRAVRLRAVRGQGCPYCYKRGQSRLEGEVVSFIKGLTDVDVVLNDRTVLEGQELDILIPGFGVAFEVNGDYWHSNDVVVSRFNKTALEYHQSKLDRALDRGVRLFFVWESDWVGSRFEVESAIVKVFGGITDLEEISVLSKLVVSG